MKFKAVLYIGLLSLGVGCSNNDPRLDGEREMLDGSVFVESDARFLVESLPALNLPDARRNTQWTHQGGNAQHYTGHLELADDVSLQWSTSIGHGDGRRHQITASPIFQDNRIFTLDSRSLVTAVGENGRVLWQKNVAKAPDDVTDASGGGLAVQGDQLFVTTGFGTVVALNVTSGEEVWTQDLAAIGRPLKKTSDPTKRTRTRMPASA